MIEAWLRGPLEGIDPYLMPAAHALTQAREDIECVADLSVGEIWTKPGGAASIGFHLRHIARSLDGLLTYARGETLTDEQRAAIAREGEPGDPASGAVELIAIARRVIDEALATIRSTPRELLLEPREVGRARLPSTVIGILGHAAEHTARHVGQIVTTAKILRGLDLSEDASA